MNDEERVGEFLGQVQFNKKLNAWTFWDGIAWKVISREIPPDRLEEAGQQD
jgi:hypothetical protein